MAFHVKDKATDQAVRLAKLKGKTLTETIREAVENEITRERAKVPAASSASRKSKIKSQRSPDPTGSLPIKLSSTTCPATSDVS